MRTYQRKVKSRKRNANVNNVQSTTALERPIGAKASLNTMSKNEIVIKQPSIHIRGTAAGLINSMNLDELLEVSKMVELGIKGEKIPTAKSPKAQKCARTILQLNRKGNTKPAAEKMINGLNERIIEVNKKTTNTAESKRLYRKLMAEE